MGAAESAAASQAVVVAEVKKAFLQRGHEVSDMFGSHCAAAGSAERGLIQGRNELISDGCDRRNTVQRCYTPCKAHVWSLPYRHTHTSNVSIKHQLHTVVAEQKACKQILDR